MKALELIVYPPIPECPQRHWGGFAYEDWVTDRAAEMKLRDRKRLTDAELAAEYWRAKWTGVITERSLQRPLPDEYRAMIAKRSSDSWNSPTTTNLPRQEAHDE